MTPPPLPEPGDVVRLDAATSVQFAGSSAMTVRVLKVHDWSTCSGWLWMRVRVLHPPDRAGPIIRDVFVQPRGLHQAATPAPAGSLAVPAGGGVAAPERADAMV